MEDNSEVKNLIEKLDDIKDKESDEYVKTLLNLSEIYYDEKQFDKAKKNLKKILQIDSEHKNVNYYLALVSLYQNDDHLARKHLKAELNINPINDNARDLLDKLEINSNFPFLTITITLICSIFFMFYFSLLDVNYTSLLKFSLNSFNSSFFSIITSIFYHVNLFHFLSNMFFFVMFGLLVEKYIGSVKFFLIFFISGIVGNLSQFLFFPDSFVLGLSSSIFGVLGAMLMREPMFNMKCFGLFNVPIIFIFGVFFVVEAFIVEYLFVDLIAVAQISHMFGFLSGILIMGFFYKDTIDTFYNWMTISLGFLAIVYSLLNLLIKEFDFNDFILGTTIILVGAFLVAYSYFKLKLIVERRSKF